MKTPRDSAQAAGAESANRPDETKIIDDRRDAAKHHRLALLFLIILSSVTFFYGLGRLALVGPDEPRYAEVAREMMTSGDYISTKLCGCLWFEKPALIYWMAAASYHLFGVNEFAARFPSALFALITVVALYLCLNRAASRAHAIISSVVLATSGIFIAYARAVTTDMALAAAMSVALLSGHFATRSYGKERLGLWSLSFASMGMAVLAKGLVGLVLVLTILALFALITRNPKAIRLKEIFLGSAVFLAVAATWYLPVVLRHGSEFINEFFIRHHFERYASDDFGHPQPFYFFFMVAIVGILPWSFFLIPAAARLKKHFIDRNTLLVFAWLWAIVPLVFYSLSRSKLPGYILPSFPAFAVIVGAEVERVWNGRFDSLLKLSSWLTAFLLVAMGAAFILYLRQEQVVVYWWQACLSALPLAVAFVGLFGLFQGRRRLFIKLATSTVLIIVVGAVIVLLPVLSEKRSLKRLSLDAAAALRPGEKITFFLRKEFAPVFYAEGRVVCGIEGAGVLNALSQDVLARALAEAQSSLIVITSSKWEDDLTGDRRFVTEFIGGQGNALAYRVTLNSEIKLAE
jgi:4-amino-4-deoxy-L-arabinose transferase-like glycosyltransferase